MQRNPYVVGMFAITGLVAAIGVISLIVGYIQAHAYAADGGAVATAGGVQWLIFAFVGLMLSLLAGAFGWRPEPEASVSAPIAGAEEQV